MGEAIGFIGLGLLGFPMATNLLDTGHLLCVYNRTASKAEPLVARGVDVARNPAGVVTRGGVVITVLWDDASLEEVVTSDGFLEALGAGGLHISMSTVSPECAERMAALHAEHGSTYLAAPVFGRPEAAVARQLLMPMAGTQAAKQRARPLLEAMGARGIYDFGEAVGAATVVKLAGNFLIVSAARSMVEALTMVEQCGVDTKAVVDMLTTTLFASPIYQNYGKMIASKAPPMQSAIPAKDLGLFKRTAENVDAPTALSTLLLAGLKA